MNRLISNLDRPTLRCAAGASVAASLAATALTGCAAFGLTHTSSSSSSTAKKNLERLPVASTVSDRLKQSCLPTTVDNSTVDGRVGDGAMVAGQGKIRDFLLIRDAEKAAQAVRSRLRQSSKQPLLVLAPQTDEQYRTWTGNSPEGKNAETVMKDGCLPFLVIDPELSKKPMLPLLRETLVHEAVHALTMSSAGAARPRWLVEGMAEYIGQDTVSTIERTSDHLVPRLPTDQQLLNDPDGRYYDAAWQFFRFLDERFGESKVTAFYEQAMASSDPLDTLTQRHFGANLQRLQADYAGWFGSQGATAV